MRVAAREGVSVGDKGMKQKTIKGRTVVFAIMGIVALAMFATVFFSNERERLKAVMSSASDPKTDRTRDGFRQIPKQLRPPTRSQTK